MKTLLLSLSLAVAGVSTSQAEIYRPSIVRETTVLGAVAGALIGGHNDDRWAEGAIIGAAAGAIIGSAVDHSGPGRVYSHREIHPNYDPSYGPGAYGPRVVYVDPAPRVVYVRPHSHRPVIVHRGHHHRSHGYHRDYRHGHGHRRDRHHHR